MAICRTGEYPTYFEEAGRGMPVVLVHGHAADLRAWDEAIPPLVAAGNRVIRYDVRGHGQSAVPDDDYTYDAYVRDLEALMAHVGSQEFVVVGHSMGGGIALTYAQRHPERAAGAVLVCPALPGFGYSEEFSAGIVELRDKIRANGVHPTIEDEFPKHAFFDCIRDDADAMDRIRAMFAGYSGRDYLVEPGPAPEGVIDGLAVMSTPTLVLAGDGDIPDFRLIAALLGERIPGAELRSLPDTGHMLPMERPAEFAAAVNAFIAARVVSSLKR